MTKILSDELIVKAEFHSYTQSAQICYLYMWVRLCVDVIRRPASITSLFLTLTSSMLSAVGRRSNLSPTLNAGRFVCFSHDCFC